MQEGLLRVVRRKDRRTIFEVHHWPSRNPARGYVCSSRCNHDDIRLHSDAWREAVDGTKLRRRLKRRRGHAKGRVLYFLARPIFSKGQSLQREAAALLSFQRHALLVYRICMRDGLVRESRIWAFVLLCAAAHRLAGEAGKPVQVYLEPGIDASRIEERLIHFKRAPMDRLTRRQREDVGSWLQRDP